MKNSTIKVNPSISHIFDGDYDGDQLHVVLPITKGGKEDALKMNICKYIQEYKEEFHPGKEIEKYSDNNWSENINELSFQLNRISNKSTNGKSISWEDLIDPDKEDSYFKDIKINSEELKSLAKGIEKEKIFTTSYDSNFKQYEGYTSTDAVRSYRVIKSLTPKSGALSNALMTLAIAKTKLMDITEEKRRDIVANVGFTKHVLCQDAISAKHGPSQVNEANKIYAGFYNSQDNNMSTKEEYIEALVSFGVPKKYAEVTIDVYWEGEPKNIMDMLRKYTPYYLLTRRTVNNKSFEDCIDTNDLSIHHTNLRDSYE